MSSAESRVVHVVAGAIIDGTGRVLIAERPHGRHLAGGWEFPGGKLEPGEERAVGLARELHEELGISIAAPRPLMRVRHAYPTREVLLDVWVVKHYRGEPRGLDGQALRWVTPEELPAADLLPADEPVVAALRLPERLTELCSNYYRVGELNSLHGPGADAPGVDALGVNVPGVEARAEASGSVQLRGVLCASATEGVAAAAAGADFLVMREVVADGEIAGLCERVPLPVYVRGIASERAWALGASGVNDIGTPRQSSADAGVHG